MVGTRTSGRDDRRAGLRIPVGQALEVAWRWWRGEIRDLLPDGLRALPRRFRCTLELRTSPQRLEVALVHGAGRRRDLGEVRLDVPDLAPSARALRDLVRRSAGVYDRVRVIVPESRVLRRQLQLPAAARASLAETVGYDLDRQTPFEATEVYYGVREIDSRAGSDTLEAELEVVRRADIDGVLAVADAAGLRVDRIDSRPDGPDLLPPDRPPSTRRNWRWGVAALALAVLLLAGALVYLPLNRLAQEQETLARAVETARTEALAVETLRQGMEVLRARERDLLARRRSRPMALDTLAAVTAELPDTSFLVGFTFDGTALEITGYSAQASALVRRLEANTAFTDAAFSSPVTNDPHIERERFNLGANLVQIAPQ